MSETIIEKLTPEQEALIPVYREKWKRIALSTERIDRRKAAEVVKAAYAEMGEKEPEIVFFDSPYAAIKTAISSQLESQLESLEIPLWRQLERQLESLEIPLWRQLERQLESLLQLKSLPESLPESLLWSLLDNQLWNGLWSLLWRQLRDELGSLLWSQRNLLKDQLWSQQESQLRSLFFDFCITVLNCAHDERQWSVYQSLVKDCGWIFPYEETCLICDRPIKLSFDDRNLPHALCEPAIEFADGWSRYYYHGVMLPEKYGKLYPNEWQAQWVLEEDNAELRRVLIQGIGYDRIIQELEATELDSWREYTLLKIDIFDDYDEENEQDLPTYLLKMTCPSTGFIHALRVPPDMKSAREAIRWVNWGIDPEEFAMQT